MNAYELLKPDGNPSNYFACGHCHTVAAGFSPHDRETSKEKAERCCAPNACWYCGKPTEGRWLEFQQGMPLLFPFTHKACELSHIVAHPAKPGHPSMYEPNAQLLYRVMSDISEERWSAGWYTGLEYLLWRELTGELTGDRSAEEEQLRTLSTLANGWIAWFDEDKEFAAGPRLVPLPEWNRMYEAQV